MDDPIFLPPVASMPIVHCAHCRFWDAHLLSRPTRTPEGLCRRKAPQPTLIGEDIDVGISWPRTFEDDWCGDGEPHAPS